MKNSNTSGLEKHLSAVHKKEFLQLFSQGQTTASIANFFKSTKTGIVMIFMFIKSILCTIFNSLISNLKVRGNVPVTDQLYIKVIILL